MLLYIAAGTICTILFFSIYHHRAQRSGYPPGPSPLPFLGNVLDLDSASPWETYRKWGERYGDLLHLNIFGRHVVVLNSVSAANDLLDRRSIYADKPDLEMLRLMGWGFNLAFMRYGDERRRKHRHILQKGVGSLWIVRIQEVAVQQSGFLLLNPSESPEDFIAHIPNYVAALILQYTLGYTDWDKYKYIIEDVRHATNVMTGSVFFGAQAVFAFPLLGRLPSWFPGAGFKELAKQQLLLTSKIRDEPLNLFRKQMTTGNHIPSRMADMLEECASGLPTAPTEEDIKDITATMLTVSDTASSVLQSLILALVLNPHVMRRAQEGIDGVIGNTRLPTFQDRHRLPYVSAVCRELLRWHPPVPLAPHAAIETDEYRGFEIPQGSAVMANIWAMSRSPDVFENADEFMPERFLDEKGSLVEDKLTNFVWGFGRTSCPGRLFAESTVWIAVARLLAVFNITKAKDPQGIEVEVQEAYNVHGLFMHPLPFKCSITPRTDESRILLEGLSGP